jgi:ferredoxin
MRAASCFATTLRASLSSRQRAPSLTGSRRADDAAGSAKRTNHLERGELPAVCAVIIVLFTLVETLRIAQVHLLLSLCPQLKATVHCGSCVVRVIDEQSEAAAALHKEKALSRGDMTVEDRPSSSVEAARLLQWR